MSGQTENGASYQAGITQSRTYNNTTFNAYNPYYLASLNLAVTQPLLKNAGMNATKRQLKLAFINADADTAQTLIDASTTISQVENTYWDLLAAWRNVAIQEEALREAIAQQQSNVRLVSRGAAAPIDAVESETQVANFQTEVFRALQTVSGLQNQLKSLVASHAGDPIWAANLVPSTSVEQLPSASDLSTVVAEAKAKRPEVRQALDRRLAAGVDVVFAKNQSLPQADVQAQYQSNGFAGILTPIPKFIVGYCTESPGNGGLGLPHCPTPPPNTQGSMPWAYHNMWAGYFPTFNIALIVGYPIQGHLARGLRGLASEETTQARVLMQGVDERIGAEARNALQSYQSALSKLNATREARESAEAVYASELRKFHNGAVDDVPLVAATARARAGPRQRVACADAAQRVRRRAATRRGHDSFQQWRQRSDAGKPGLCVRHRDAVKLRSLPAIVGAMAIALAALPVQRTAAQLESPASRATLPTPMPSPRFPVVPSVAPGYRAPQVAPSAAQIVGVTQQPFVGISLQDAIAMALLKNPNLAVSASNVRIARYTIVEVKGAYDVQLQLKPSSSFSVQPPDNAFEAGPGEIGRYTPKPGSGSTPGPIYTTGPGNIIQHESGFQYGVGGQTENGLTYQAGIAQSRTYNNTVFNAYNPYYIATLNLALTQPLLKSAGMNATKRQLKLAFVNADASAAQALIDASSTIAQVENAYWNLVAAWRNVAIQEEALKEAIAQQQSNVRLGRRGALAPIEAVESQTQVSNFADDVFSALQTVSQLQVALKSLVVADPGDAIWTANLVPSTSVEELPSAGDLAQIIAEGRRNRPEVRQAQDKRLAADIDRSFAANQSLPQADVQVQYLSNGFAGILAPVPGFLLGECLALEGG